MNLLNFNQKIVIIFFWIIIIPITTTFYLSITLDLIPSDLIFLFNGTGITINTILFMFYIDQK